MLYPSNIGISIVNTKMITKLITFVIIIASTETGFARKANPIADERQKMEYLNNLVPDFFLSISEAGTAQWSSAKTLAQEVLTGIVTDAMVQDLGRNLAKLHQLSRKTSLTDSQFSHQVNVFRDTSKKDLVSNAIFTGPFNRDLLNDLHPEVKEKAENLIFHDKVKSLANRLQGLYDKQDECLIGGNFTPEKTLIKDGKTHIVDPQFVGHGPAAFDIASYVSYFIMAYHHHMLIPEDHDNQHKIAMKMVDLTEKFVGAYLEEIQMENKEEYVEQLMSDTAAFSGILVIGRCLNAEMTPQLDNRKETAIEALQSGMLLLTRHDRMNSISRILTISLMLL